MEDFTALLAENPLAAHDQKVREPLAAWMIENSFATGHGDTVEDLLKELKWQIEERVGKVREQVLEEVESKILKLGEDDEWMKAGLVVAAIRALASKSGGEA